MWTIFWMLIIIVQKIKISKNVNKNNFGEYNKKKKNWEKFFFYKIKKLFTNKKSSKIAQKTKINKNIQNFKS